MKQHVKRLLELEQLFGVDLLPVSKRAKATAKPVAKKPAEALPPDWVALRDEALRCTKCEELCSTRRQVVFGVGSIAAPLMFVGEAPGEDEDLQGEPFVGRAGQILTATLSKCGVSRAQVYIGNVLKCRPPGNRTPAPREMMNCMPFLLRQITIIKPKLLCVLGNIAAKALLNTTTGITKLRGRYHDFDGTKTFAAYHPAYVLRNMAELGTFEADIRRVCTDAGLAT